jgi:hypothetical protein
LALFVGLRAMMQASFFLSALAASAALAIGADDAAVSSPAQATVDRSAPATSAPAQNPRVLFITTANSTKSDETLARLRRPGGDFDKLRSHGWKIGEGPENHLQIVDRLAIPELVERLQVREFPAAVCVDRDQIVRSFTSGCTTPLDVWTFGFLAKGVDERPAGMVTEAARAETTGHYPLRGNHWSIDEDWNPTKSRVISHLRGPNHGPQIRAGWEIESWSYEELRSLHDNLHEQEMGGVSSSTRQQPANQFSAARKIGGK